MDGISLITALFSFISVVTSLHVSLFRLLQRTCLVARAQQWSDGGVAVGPLPV